MGGPSAWESAAAVAAISGLPTYKTEAKSNYIDPGGSYGGLSIPHQFLDPLAVPDYSLVRLSRSHLRGHLRHIRQNSIGQLFNSRDQGRA